MDIYRATLRPHSPTRTPWQADTLFGHLCWAMREADGEPALNDFLLEYSAEPSFVLSDGFPGDYLPRPMLPRPRRPVAREHMARLTALAESKADKRTRWITLPDFNALRRGEWPEKLIAPELHASRTVLKNQINRLTGGTTPIADEAPGHLFFADEYAYTETKQLKRSSLEVTVYVKVRDGKAATRVERLLWAVADSGYGAKTTSGYGQFTLQAWEHFDRFESVPEPNGFVSLSNWTPAAGDPREGYYRTVVKYGKLGNINTFRGNPFKRPLVMLTAGSTFYAQSVRDWYGRLVSDIAPQTPEVVQYGLSFALPTKLAEEG